MQPMTSSSHSRGAIARGIAATGPAVLSYGFRPFFLLAGLWAVAAMGGWVGALTLGWMPGGAYGALNWHVHELLFGYAGAAMAGFMLTAIPNWTGRLPVSGAPLGALVVLWIAGRLALGFYDWVGMWPALVVESAFFPVLGAIAAREILAGRNRRNFHIIAGLAALSGANVWFHWAAVTGNGAGAAERLGVAAWVLLIGVVGGRMAVSFTRNWLARNQSPVLPKPLGGFDHFTLIVTLVGLLAWIVMPDNMVVGALLVVAGLLHVWRMIGWRGWRAAREPLVLMLHVFYAFIPAGLLAIGAVPFGLFGAVPALHLLTVGAVGGMTLAVMTRATRGHTGRPLRASGLTIVSYLALVIAALARPLADVFGGEYMMLVSISGVAWIAAFLGFVIEYAPMLLRPRAS